METRVEGSGAPDVEALSVCLSGGSLVPITEEVCAASAECHSVFIFRCTLWLGEVVADPAIMSIAAGWVGAGVFVVVVADLVAKAALLRLAGPCGAPGVCARFTGRVVSVGMRLKSWANLWPLSGVLHPDGWYTPLLIHIWWNTMWNVRMLYHLWVRRWS
jgi:hypothetical protein